MNELTIVALKRIVEDEGPEVFQAPYRFWAIFEDLIGGHYIEGSILLFLAKKDLLPRLGEAYVETRIFARTKILEDVFQQLLEGSEFTREDVLGFFRCLCVAYRWPFIPPGERIDLSGLFSGLWGREQRKGR